MLPTINVAKLAPLVRVATYQICIQLTKGLFARSCSVLAQTSQVRNAVDVVFELLLQPGCIQSRVASVHQRKMETFIGSVCNIYSQKALPFAGSSICTEKPGTVSLELLSQGCCDLLRKFIGSPFQSLPGWLLVLRGNVSKEITPGSLPCAGKQHAKYTVLEGRFVHTCAFYSNVYQPIWKHLSLRLVSSCHLSELNQYSTSMCWYFIVKKKNLSCTNDPNAFYDGTKTHPLLSSDFEVVCIPMPLQTTANVCRRRASRWENSAEPREASTG